MRYQRYILISAFPMVFAASGCSVVGKWELASVDPTAALRDLEYQAFTLQKDGSFYGEAERSEVAAFTMHSEGNFRAEAQEEKKGISTESGVYRYDDGTLTLTPHEGKEVTYQARLIDGGNKLEVKKTWKDRTVKAIFNRKE
jgi:hypothetical protein